MRFMLMLRDFHSNDIKTKTENAAKDSEDIETHT